MNPIQISRESIFISAIRSFCNTFFAILGLMASALIIGLIISFGMSSSSDTGKTSFAIQPDASGSRTPLPMTTPALLKITLDGIIGTGSLTTSSIENLLMDSREGLLKNSRVKGVLLCMNTPGGTVTDSNGIYEALQTYKERYKVPVFAYIDGTCASGGMYITSAADKVYASSISIVGSIGVILGPIFNFYGLMEKWGVQATTISKGKNKAMLNPFAPLQEHDDASLQTISEYLYDHFVNLVVKARTRLDRGQLVDVYGAQVYAAPEAERIGFIDSTGASYSQTVAALAAAAGIQESEPYQVIECKIHRPFLSDLVDSSLLFSPVTKLLKILPLKKESSHLQDPFLYLYHPKTF